MNKIGHHISRFTGALISALLLVSLSSVSPLWAASNEIHILKLDDATINPVTTEYIVNSIDRAEKENIQCLIIELDTPGGLLTSTRSIVKKILSSRVPIVVYIYPKGSRAGSAGVFITYASHVAAMAPSTNIGAAHPVELGNRRTKERTVWDTLKDAIDESRKKRSAQEETPKAKEKADKHETKEAELRKETEKTESDEDPLSNKILNDTVAFIKAMAEERNRNVEWAILSVTQSASITEQEALKKNVIEIIAQDENDLLNQLDGRVVRLDKLEITLKTKDAVIKHVDMDFRQRFLNILANPNIAYIFFILGFYGLLYEVTHPGVGLPGVLGTIFLILAFFSMQMLPTNYAGLALIILAIILFIAEAKTAGFGLLALGGLVCMILGSFMLFDSPVPVMRVSLSIILAFSLTTAAITIFLVRLVLKSHRKKVVSGSEGLIGEVGYAQTDIPQKSEGKVFVHGEIWNAIAEEDINKDDKITVVEVSGMLLKVKKSK